MTTPLPPPLTHMNPSSRRKSGRLWEQVATVLVLTAVGLWASPSSSCPEYIRCLRRENLLNRPHLLCCCVKCYSCSVYRLWFSVDEANVKASRIGHSYHGASGMSRACRTLTFEMAWGAAPVKGESVSLLPSTTCNMLYSRDGKTAAQLAYSVRNFPVGEGQAARGGIVTQPPQPVQ